MTDGRLLVPAMAAWLGAAGCRAGLATVGGSADRHAGAILVAAVLLPLLGLTAAAATVVLRGGAPRATAVIGAAFALLGALVAAGQSALFTAPPIGGWVDQRATAVVDGLIATEPVVRQQPTDAVWQVSVVQEFRLAADRIGARGETVAAELPLLVRTDPGVAIPPPGTRVVVTGRLVPAPTRSAAVAKLTVRPAAAGIPRLRVIGEPGPVDRLAHAMRTGLRAALAGVPPDAGSLVAGLAVGDESGQPVELADAMRVSGLSHLTAVSGGNVAVILAAVLGVAAALRLPLWTRVLLALAALGFFVVLVGPQPSVLRAAAMGVIAVAGLLVGGRRAGPSVLGAGVLVMLILSPDLSVSWAFALSAGATAGLVLLAPVIADRLARAAPTRRWPPALREALALTAAAQVATLPLLVAMGASFGWVALPANLLAMPAVAPVTVLGLAAATVAPMSGTVASALAWLAAWPAGWIAMVARTGAGLPMSRVPWPEGAQGVGWLLGALVFLVLVLHVLPRRLPPRWSRPARRATVTVIAAVTVTVLVLPPGRRAWPPPGWFLIMCDVGQGDALLLRAGPGAAVVVDTGPDPALADRCLSDAGIVTVPALVLTHFHADHVGGLAGVLRGRSVAVVLATPVREPADQAGQVDAVLAASGLPAQVLTAGDRRRVGAVDWRALWPRRVVASGSVPNNASIVLDVHIDGHRVLLPGDVEPEAQAAIASDVRGAAFDVLKVAHHGSRFQSASLADAVTAAVALVSVGAGNDYGHPAPETIAYWQARGAMVARTDLDGDVAVVSAAPGVGVVRRGAGP